MEHARKSEPTITVEHETPDQPDIAQFLTKADQWSVSLYPIDSQYGPPLSALLSSNVRFFVARQAGRAVVVEATHSLVGNFQQKFA
jgi:hypothetical protein